MRRLIMAGLAALALAACGTRGGPAATTTAIVLVQGTSPLATAAPPSETAAVATATPASTENAATAATAATATVDPAATAEPGLAAAGSDPLLRTYRAMVAIQLNAALVSEAVAQVQAGRLDEDEMPVAALALGALTQSVDEALPGVTPPPELDSQWQAALAHHEEVKALGARWLIGQVSVADVSAALVPIQADLQRLLAEADAALAAEYRVDVSELTVHRERLVESIGNVFE